MKPSTQLKKLPDVEKLDHFSRFGQIMSARICGHRSRANNHVALFLVPRHMRLNLFGYFRSLPTGGGEKHRFWTSLQEWDTSRGPVPLL
jgi:hypothetical protein